MVALLGFSLAIPAWAQSSPVGLNAYADCTFSDGLMVVRTDPLPSNVSSRPVETDAGIRHIDLEGGLRIMFAYPLEDFFANVKAEKLPSQKFPALKQDLLANFQHLAHSNTINSSLQSPMNGFEIHGMDREKLEGGVLGVYLLFHDSDATVTTIYFLNQQSFSRHFQTMDAYRSLRDRFLTSYTACIRTNLQQAK